MPSLCRLAFAALSLSLIAPAGPAGAEPPPGYARVWADEFDSFDVDRWQRRYYWGGRGGHTLTDNGEQQWYVWPDYSGSCDRALGIDPFAVVDGALTIEARPTPPALRRCIEDYGFTSGVITTAGSFAVRYGYVETRVRLPSGQGLWPAFWMLPEDPAWPPELDVFEVHGSDPSRVFHNQHWLEDGDHSANGGWSELRANTTEWTVFGFEWTAEELVWTINGRESMRRPNHVHEPMILIFNLAVGGHWPGPVDETTPFPARMAIDYVRVYRRDD